MPDNSPCTCPVVWSVAPAAATITPGCPVHGGAPILRNVANQIRVFDPECANTLDDMAAEYAGPWTAVDPQVSDEEWARSLA